MTCTKEPNFLTDPVAIQKWLENYCSIVGEVTISADGLVSVNGTVRFINKQWPALKQFAVQFDTVSETFDCSYLKELESLRGAPQHVGHHFYCNGCCKLKDLTGAPGYVGGLFDCSFCGVSLLSVAGSPAYVGGNFSCGSNTHLRDLNGSPSHIGGILECETCYGLTLEGLRVPNVRIVFRHLAAPDAAIVRNLCHLRVKLDTDQIATWISIVNDYHKSGDILTAIAQFEAFYGEPFAGIMGTTATLMAVPEL